MKERILQKARDLFMRYGFRSVTMDEIAGQMGISKKTLYQFFEDKDSLVEIVMQGEMAFIETECRRQDQESENAIDELFKDMDSMYEVMDSMNPQIIYDLEKFYPRTFEKFKQHKHSFMLDVIRNNIFRGIREGLYRPEIDVDIAAKFRLESNFLVFNQELFPYGKYSILKVASEINYLFIHGISTAKGKKLIEKYIQQRQQSKTLTV